MSVLGAVALAAHDVPWWHTLAGWSSFGGAIGGTATALLAVLAYLGGKAGLDDFRQRQRAQADLASEQAYNLRLERQRPLYGWAASMINVYAVERVTSRDEMDQARDELLAKRGSEYVILRAKDGPHAAHQVRQLVDHGFLARPPTLAERDALNRWVASQDPGGKWVEPLPAPEVTVSRRAWWKALKKGRGGENP